MDSKGWLPIHLIANFNRVKQLTQDSQLVRDVLEISSLVELRGEHVRLSNGQWENYVLPSAAPSIVEGEGGDSGVSNTQSVHAGNGDEDEEDDEQGEDGGEDDEDDQQEASR